MNLFEYQAKEAFRECGITTPRGVLVRSVEELDAAFAETGFPCVLKSQVLRGGRGKAGLIRVAGDAETGKKEAGELLSQFYDECCEIYR